MSSTTNDADPAPRLCGGRRASSKILVGLLVASCGTGRASGRGSSIDGDSVSCAEASEQHREQILSAVCVQDVAPGGLLIVSGATCAAPDSKGAQDLLDALTSFPRFYNGTLDLVDRWAEETGSPPSSQLREHFSASPLVNAMLDDLPGRLVPDTCAPTEGAGDTVVGGGVAIAYAALHVWPTQIDESGNAAVFICGGSNGVVEQAMVAPEPTLVRLGFLAAFHGESFRALAEGLSARGSDQGSARGADQEGSTAKRLATLPPTERLAEIEKVVAGCPACLDEICATAQRFSWFLGVRVSECDEDGRWRRTAARADASPT